MSASEIPAAALELALRVRAQKRRRGNGTIGPPSWDHVARELARAGYGRLVPYNATDVAAACATVPIELHPAAPPPEEQLRAVDDSWREGWREEFPGEPWPGRAEAIRRLRERLRSDARGGR